MVFKASSATLTLLVLLWLQGFSRQLGALEFKVFVVREVRAFQIEIRMGRSLIFPMMLIFFPQMSTLLKNLVEKLVLLKLALSVWH